MGLNRVYNCGPYSLRLLRVSTVRGAAPEGISGLRRYSMGYCLSTRISDSFPGSLHEAPCRQYHPVAKHCAEAHVSFIPQSLLWTITTGCVFGKMPKNSCILSLVRYQASKPSAKSAGKSSKAVAEAKETPFGELTVGQKVKQAGKDVTYTGIIIGGIVVTGLMFYAIGRELFSGQSPSGVYGRAFKICKKNEEVVIALGEPIKGYGEMTRRGRRRHVSHQEYEVDGVRQMRMKFYVEGPANKGTVHLDAKKNDRGKYEFRYIFVELENYPRKTIIVEDTR